MPNIRCDSCTLRSQKSSSHHCHCAERVRAGRNEPRANASCNWPRCNRCARQTSTTAACASDLVAAIAKRGGCRVDSSFGPFPFFSEALIGGKKNTAATKFKKACWLAFSNPFCKEYVSNPESEASSDGLCPSAPSHRREKQRIAILERCSSTVATHKDHKTTFQRNAARQPRRNKTSDCDCYATPTATLGRQPWVDGSRSRVQIPLGSMQLEIAATMRSMQEMELCRSCHLRGLSGPIGGNHWRD